MILEGSDSYEILYNFGLGYIQYITENNSITLPLSGAATNVFYLEQIVQMISNLIGHQFNLSL